MDIMSYLSVFIINVAGVPNAGADIFIRHLIKDTITSEDNKIMIFCNLKYFNIRNASYYIWISSSEFNLSLWIPKSSWYWKSSWQNSNRPNNVIRLALFLSSNSRSTCGCSSLINLSSCCDNSLIFYLLRWFMIKT